MVQFFKKLGGDSFCFNFSKKMGGDSKIKWQLGLISHYWSLLLAEQLYKKTVLSTDSPLFAPLNFSYQCFYSYSPLISAKSQL